MLNNYLRVSLYLVVGIEYLRKYMFKVCFSKKFLYIENNEFDIFLCGNC